MKPYLVLIIAFLALNQINAQRFSSKINRLGLGADATFLQLDSDQVASQTQIGYAGYFDTRGEFNRFFDVVYSIGIFNHNIDFEEFGTSQTISSSMLGAEIKLLAAFRPFQTEYFTLEAGPALMLNGEFKLDDVDSSKLVGTDVPVTLEEFEKTNPINLNGVVGFSAGTNGIRLTAHYHYALFDALDSVDTLGNELEGNLGYLSAGLRVYF
ncbi:hypothetical protein [Nonlabens agnitus]|uniref:Outer membrane protein beta-barrel domain-containing protein n=1 Tax=Nonlabens agnitus TaxID=870484 RepID=A0A2S9WWE5_9FLAO|nr:hypothetical protein [Nonlabens agnitus]PRP67761.1 hypothetical protein BST86_11995 [Nonlabens agnitus]